MNDSDPNAFSLDVETAQLRRALNYLRKFESGNGSVHLTYGSGMLTLSIGRTSREMPATGAWPSPVSVARAWADTLTKVPFEAAITTLRIADGWLWARNFKVEYSLDPRMEETEDTLKREGDFDSACQILASHKVTIEEIAELVGKADPNRARLWGPGDGRIIDDVASAWKELAFSGVQTSAIRSLLDRKSRELWRSASKLASSSTKALNDYKLTQQDKNDLIGEVDSEKRIPWRPAGGGLLEEVVLAWKELVLYGVEPSEILYLLQRKSR